MCESYKVIQVAKSQIGYLEKSSDSQLDDFTANAGRENYTKYARDYKGFAGEDYQGQAWCDMFVDWCFVKAYGVDNARDLLGGFDAYTPASAQYFKARGRWHTSDPQPGDVIFFENSQRINHTGIVTEVKDGRVHTVEGNTSGGGDVVANGGGVWSKSYALDNSKIAGYGRPAYVRKSDQDYVTGLYHDLLGWEPNTPVMTYQRWLNTYLGGYLKEPLEIDGKCGAKTRKAAVMAMQVYLNKMCGARLAVDGSFGPKSRTAYETVRRGRKGDNVCIVQGLLYGHGYDPAGFDGSCGAGCERAIKQYQANTDSLAVDGHCGKATFRALVR
ncbi:peptidoglycan-binding protein [Hominifimenecus sp. rT4P-3]|uniref:peptidoglycan-binding protein n=1 Tax=Hominifimenecus sp. rT4P-3 TaxID=3242979 RepID=UPI003DA42674